MPNIELKYHDKFQSFGPIRGQSLNSVWATLGKSDHNCFLLEFYRGFSQYAYHIFKPASRSSGLRSLFRPYHTTPPCCCKDLFSVTERHQSPANGPEHMLFFAGELHSLLLVFKSLLLSQEIFFQLLMRRNPLLSSPGPL